MPGGGRPLYLGEASHHHRQHRHRHHLCHHHHRHHRCHHHHRHHRRHHHHKIIKARSELYQEMVLLSSLAELSTPGFNICQNILT